MFSTLILPDGARTADGQTLEAAQLMWLKIHNRRVASRFSGVSRLAAPASSCAIASAQTLLLSRREKKRLFVIFKVLLPWLLRPWERY